MLEVCSARVDLVAGFDDPVWNCTSSRKRRKTCPRGPCSSGGGGGSEAPELVSAKRDKHSGLASSGTSWRPYRSVCPPPQGITTPYSHHRGTRLPLWCRAAGTSPDDLCSAP